MRKGFTLLELLVSISIVAVLAALLMPALRAARLASSKAISAHSLRNLATAGRCYLNEHDNNFWSEYEYQPGGCMWWWGWESNASLGHQDGQRYLDYTRGPLGPYAIASSNVKTDPALLAYSPRLKPKYQNGNYGYGYNTLLAHDPGDYSKPRNAIQCPTPSQVVMFATCAQVNTFQPPASPKNPMVEEFYFIYDSAANSRINKTVHFRHGGKALVAFLDGSVREVGMSGSNDPRMPSAEIGSLSSNLLTW